jgi:hypothetical protein
MMNEMFFSTNENTVSNGASTADVTTESMEKLIRDHSHLFLPPVTPEQRAWAYHNKYPGFPGFKLGAWAWAELMAWNRDNRVIRGRSPMEPVPFDGFCGVPICLDSEIDPWIVLSAETEWKKAIAPKETL